MTIQEQMKSIVNELISKYGIAYVISAKEIKKLIDTAYKRAEIILSENMNILHEVAQLLLIKETIIEYPDRSHSTKQVPSKKTSPYF